MPLVFDDENLKVLEFLQVKDVLIIVVTVVINYCGIEE